MSIINLNVDSCQNCYKCIRQCPLKAIEFKDGKTKIIESECVLCGVCVQICPRNAKFLKCNTQKVKDLIKSDKPVYVSVAPSWMAWYNNTDFSKLSMALKKLGFTHVEETAIGAAHVTHEYENLMQSGQMKNIIATSCASVVMLIERHFPQLIKMLAPVSSPMMAHARLMREAYGDIKVVFIGPCLSKFAEADDPLAGGLVNEVLTFEDIDNWMQDENVVLNDIDQNAVGVQNEIARLYPKQSGIIKTISSDCFTNYRPIAVDGIYRCMELFNSIQNEDISKIFVEANICAGSCIGGPIMRMHNKSIIGGNIITTGEVSPVDKVVAKSALAQFPHPRVFANRESKMEKPTLAQINEILASIGKTTPEQELDCGSCGYATCREKAVAVFQGKADATMCLPFLRERAENMSTIVIEHSPNGIITLDENLLVTEINPKAELLFGVTRAEIIGEMIPALYGEESFSLAKQTNKNIVKNCDGANEHVKIELSVIYIQQRKIFVAFAKDISAQENDRNQLADLRLTTLGVAQEVINKQMRVAQEIASLLGETTAETKVALTNLKKSIRDI
ncbi:MAG: [Fe-Fe] hydrogenase large subunit C-terminal domain-containing protein [Oscillospiraceae bacterium]